MTKRGPTQRAPCTLILARLRRRTTLQDTRAPSSIQDTTMSLVTRYQAGHSVNMLALCQILRFSLVPTESLQSSRGDTSRASKEYHSAASLSHAEAPLCPYQFLAALFWDAMTLGFGRSQSWKPSVRSGIDLRQSIRTTLCHGSSF
jgi:hypothetical protein